MIADITTTAVPLAALIISAGSVLGVMVVNRKSASRDYVGSLEGNVESLDRRIQAAERQLVRCEEMRVSLVEDYARLLRRVQEFDEK
jgi:predicted nuclease with TOPRIM domain